MEPSTLPARNLSVKLALHFPPLLIGPPGSLCHPIIWSCCLVPPVGPSSHSFAPALHTMKTEALTLWKEPPGRALQSDGVHAGFLFTIRRQRAVSWTERQPGGRAPRAPPAPPAGLENDLFVWLAGAERLEPSTSDPPELTSCFCILLQVGADPSPARRGLQPIAVRSARAGRRLAARRFGARVSRHGGWLWWESVQFFCVLHSLC